MKLFALIGIDIKTIQKETPDKPVPIDNYIKIANYGWFKQVTDKQELELLGDGR
ncbi:MAG: hypothetical protein J6T10_24490 [Methanobrevibacter sp.]|nr:hypothetical protein [Methanobrevibacter sp.]